LFLLWACPSLQFKHHGQGGESYGDLGNQTTYPLYQQAQVLLSSLNSTSLPSQVKPLRSALGLFRDMLDLFAYAYPNCSFTDYNGDCVDVWRILRESVNVGYTIIGNYQDLSHSGVNYTTIEMDKLLDICLTWKAGYYVQLQDYDFEKLVINPSFTELYIRNKTELSTFYWGTIPTIPNLNISGVDNIAFLEYNLVISSLENYDRVMDMKEVYTNGHHNRFHDYRKLSRAILSVVSFKVYNDNDTCVTNALAVVKEMYDNFGDLNNVIVAYDFYMKHGDKTGEKEEQALVISGWATLQKWMVSAQFAQQLICLSESLIYS